MNNFFYIDSENKQCGPCSLESLKAAGITRKTMVWFSGLDDWTPAGQIEQLSTLFEPQPPAYHNDNPSQSKQNIYAHILRPSSWLVWSILATIFCCQPLAIVGIIYASKVDIFWSVGKYEEALKAASNARKWTLLSILISVIGFLVFFIISIIQYDFFELFMMNHFM